MIWKINYNNLLHYPFKGILSVDDWRVVSDGSQDGFSWVSKTFLLYCINSLVVFKRTENWTSKRTLPNCVYWMYVCVCLFISPIWSYTPLACSGPEWLAIFIFYLFVELVVGIGPLYMSICFKGVYFIKINFLCMLWTHWMSLKSTKNLLKECSNEYICDCMWKALYNVTVLFHVMALMLHWNP